MTTLDVTPEEIMSALAAQIDAGIEDDYNVYWFPLQNPPLPAITIWPGADTFVDYYTTMGPDGLADMMLRVRADVGAIDSENVALQMTRLHATGRNARSSIMEAVNRDPTLGGVVEHAKVLTSEWPIDDGETSSGIAWWPTRIIFKKDGAAA